VIPRAERGKYDLIRSVRGYVKYLQERAEGRGVEPTGLHEERMRLLTAQAEHKELEVAELQRSLLPSDDVMGAWEQLVAAFRARCLAIPARMAPRLAAMNERERIQDALTAEVREALQEGPRRSRSANSQRRWRSVRGAMLMKKRITRRLFSTPTLAEGV
jgi:phage terminase Nu1 subunit (DNA packaging protein)